MAKNGKSNFSTDLFWQFVMERNRVKDTSCCWKGSLPMPDPVGTPAPILLPCYHCPGRAASPG